MRTKPLASLSLDLDNQWSYMKTHGDAEWETYPSYLPVVVPVLLDIFEKLDIKITFFIVGKDASFEENKKYLKDIADKGHNVGNHTFRHEVWLPSLSNENMQKEIEAAEKIITEVTGKKPVGFRGPGFAWSPALLGILMEKGYRFDASTLPTFIGPLARLYYFLTSDFTAEERKKRDTLFGSFKDGFRPVRPYYWQSKDKRLLEIPVTVMPFFRIPFHVSYLLYISRFSEKLMWFYLNMAILLCRVTRTQPSILLHPLDIIGAEKVPELKFFPGMDIETGKKTELFSRIVGKLKKHYTLVTMEEHAEAMKTRDTKRKIRIRQLN